MAFDSFFYPGPEEEEEVVEDEVEAVLWTTIPDFTRPCRAGRRKKSKKDPKSDSAHSVATSAAFGLWEAALSSTPSWKLMPRAG